jgi:tyrosyl-tRNA synthetase
MTTPSSLFLKTLAERGFVHQCTDLGALDERLSAGPVAAYIGFDATADSLHVGSLVQIMALRWLQKSGHKPVVLIGRGTTQIGDPSFRDTSRPLLDHAQIAKNAEGLRKVFSRYLAFGDGPTDAVMLDNASWLDPLRYLPFLRDFGTHFTINRMLSFDSVRQRLEREQPLTLLEFNYMVLQAFDFLELSRSHGCLLQMGGSDQWGNIVNGIELARRIDQRQLFGLTTPLLTTSAGAKMGKTAGGRRGLAQCRAAEPLRVLAVLAQHRGRRRRPLPSPLHGIAARRGAASWSPAGRGAERGEAYSRHRGHMPRPWRRGCRGHRGDGSPHLRRGAVSRGPAGHRCAKGGA